MTAGRCCVSAGLLAPSAIVALLPKCPVCLAAYLARGTGIGFSVTAAQWVQTAAIASCVAAVVVLALRVRSTRPARAQGTRPWGR
jgi:hypothetical protein